MNKKITIELTQEEYDAICKLWEMAKSSPVMPSKALNFDDFCKETLVNLSKTNNDLSNFNMEEFMSQLGDLGNLDNLKDMISAFGKKKPEAKPQEKKDEIPDDKKYKS